MGGRRKLKEWGENEAKKMGGEKKKEKNAGKKCSREWFRSIDLWVMGPARSHCATLLVGRC